jgi:hypothetical protein
MCVDSLSDVKRLETLKGFSIAEVLLALFIMTVGMLAISGLLVSSMKHSTGARDEIIATELAQEGIELVRNVRDNDVASGGTGFTAFDSSKKHCRIDYEDDVDSLDCSSSQGSDSRYYLQYSGGFYAHFNEDKERYSRYVHIDYDGSDGAVVKSIVYWGDFVPSSSGNTESCTSANQCVFTESELRTQSK